MTTSEWITQLLIIHTALNYTPFLETLLVYVAMYLPVFYLAASQIPGIKFDALTGEPAHQEDLTW